MKKVGLLIAMVFVFAMPLFVEAKGNYVSQNFKEILKEEEIELAYPAYEETKDQVTIYMFRGFGCQYCRSFLNYLNSIVEEYGKYFKVVGYEVWYDENNSKLMQEVSDFFGDDARGVPYIVIGDTTFAGYTESYNEQIISAIEEEYNKKDKYDVFEAMDEKERQERIEAFVKSFLPPILSFVFVAIGTTVVVLFTNKKFNKLEEKLEGAKKYQEPEKRIVTEIKEQVNKHPNKSKKK